MGINYTRMYNLLIMDLGFSDEQIGSRLQEIFLKKEYSKEDTGLSYRMINNWSEKELISDFRASISAWHKFSLSELIEVLIYKELRDFGFPISNISMIKTFFENRQKIAISPKFIVCSPLLTAIIKACFVKDIFLYTDKKAETIEFIEEDSFKLHILGSSGILISLRSIIKLLPFSGTEIIGAVTEHPINEYLKIEKTEYQQLTAEVQKRKFESIKPFTTHFIN